MSTADHPQPDGQTERVNRVLVDALKNYAHLFHHWSDCLPISEFAINNSVHVSTGHTTFYVNATRHPRVPSMLGAVAPSLSGGGYPVLPKPNKHADMTNISAVSTRARTARSPFNESTVSTPGVDTLNINEQHTQAAPVVNKDAELNTDISSKAVDFVQRRQAVIRFVQDAIAASVDRQKLNADNSGRGNTNDLNVGSLVLLATQNLTKHAVPDFGACKLAPRFIGPFTVSAKHGNAYRLDIPSSMRLHPIFYGGRLKPYSQHESPRLGDSAPTRVHKAARFDPRSTCTVCETCTIWVFNSSGSCIRLRAVMEPQTVDEAMNKPNADKWKDALEKEYGDLMRNCTWELVERLDNKKALTSKWRFVRKADALGNVIRHRARITIKGCQQRYGVDFWETLSCWWVCI
ncbi:unnamed protein product [Phytophthora fragariaefolia]|uniref:Unnamed protein product n=1 Tax=Phytophthora fragariaefolia TaxID=1490495 RepID=A0A9W6TRR1_9STRA|nr:unnamed protein product [Phytophthora fragariaefolia]